MRRLCLLLAGVMALAAPALGAGEPDAQPFAFVVPVSLGSLHKNLTLLRVRCWVLPGMDWHTMTGALGEGVSGPEDTQLAHGKRSFIGEVTVHVPLHDPRQDPSAAHSYRCQVELYDAAGRVWGDAQQIDKRYPMKPGAVNVTETGGRIGA